MRWRKPCFCCCGVCLFTLSPSKIEFRLKMLDMNNRRQRDVTLTSNETNKGQIQIQTAWKLFQHRGKIYITQHDTLMRLVRAQIYTFHTRAQIHTHRRHVEVNRILINWMMMKPNPSCMFFSPFFSPSPPPLEVHFILQFIYIYIVFMHKKKRSSQP